MVRLRQRFHPSAMHTLREELKEFAPDALTTLLEDLEADRVGRGGWSTCVLSYKKGAPGSCREDRLGRENNVFTLLWDSEAIYKSEVIQVVKMEISRRRVEIPKPEEVTACPRS